MKKRPQLDCRTHRGTVFVACALILAGCGEGGGATTSGFTTLAEDDSGEETSTEDEGGEPENPCALGLPTWYAYEGECSSYLSSQLRLSWEASFVEDPVGEDCAALHQVWVAELDGDPGDELIVFSDASTGSLWQVEDDGLQYWKEGPERVFSPSGHFYFDDFDADGFLDVIEVSARSYQYAAGEARELWVQWGTQMGQWSEPEALALPELPGLVLLPQHLVGEAPRLVGVDPALDGPMALSLASRELESATLAGTPLELAAVGDFDGDGQGDFVERAPDGHGLVHRGQADGSFVVETLVDQQISLVETISGLPGERDVLTMFLPELGGSGLLTLVYLRDDAWLLRSLNTDAIDRSYAFDLHGDGDLDLLLGAHQPITSGGDVEPQPDLFSTGLFLEDRLYPAGPSHLPIAWFYGSTYDYLGENPDMVPARAPSGAIWLVGPIGLVQFQLNTDPVCDG